MTPSSDPAKSARRRIAVAAVSILTIAAACSDSPPDTTDASVTNDAGNTPDVHVVDAVPDVPTDTQQSVDAADDATDAATDAATEDAADATDDAADAMDDVATDAGADVDTDAADASSDASDDAADASDAAIIDAGKGCKGIFCMVGHTCCNNIASVNYGKCELTTCTTCCM